MFLIYRQIQKKHLQDQNLRNVKKFKTRSQNISILFAELFHYIIYVINILSPLSLFRIDL